MKSGAIYRGSLRRRASLRGGLEDRVKKHDSLGGWTDCGADVQTKLSRKS